MRVVVVTDPGVLELNFMWLPTWIGINGELKKEIEGALSDMLVGKAMTTPVLDEANDLVIQYLVKKFHNVVGLSDYLDGLKFVQ